MRLPGSHLVPHQRRVARQRRKPAVLVPVGRYARLVEPICCRGPARKLVQPAPLVLDLDVDPIGSIAYRADRQCRPRAAAGEGAAMDTGPPEQHREVRSTVAGVGSPLEGLET
ncbi:hypothetical protein ZWY2020_007695 [Hordeum vulgare]|nr:hypothetical protein ZWY2020_007695 [Hordeum vulgare]